MKILSVQYLRGLAALLVVVAHNALLLPDGMAAHIPGALGVDIFFIISGFIMTFITAQSAERPLPFLIKRFFRIWPVFFLVWLAAWTLVYNEREFQQMGCVLYFCLQDYSSTGPVFGYSALGPPWTLTYEVLFYTLFTLAMCISYRQRSLVCSLMFIVASVGFQLAYNGSITLSSQASPDLVVNAWWQAWIKLISNTIVFEFITGMLLAELVVSGNMPALRTRGRRIVWLALAAAAGIALLTGPQPFGLHGGYWLAAIIMACVILLSDGRQSAPQPVLNFLGNISYSLYLVHYPLRRVLLNQLPADASAGTKLLIFALSVSGSIALAALLFRYVERYAIRAGKKLADSCYSWFSVQKS
ncbi:acyltransferase [Pantoea sp. Ae16]|uniref:acyltransferase family protein n=1 Tax=Pantoea TaxID=53335 RepID=UPI0008FD1256|nr:acyltransferase [Pantoea sp. Ae16]OIX94148.1 exoz [Pantoea sp. Ae16]